MGDSDNGSDNGSGCGTGNDVLTITLVSPFCGSTVEGANDALSRNSCSAMAYPNAYHGNIGPNFAGRFPNHSDRPFDFRELFEGIRPGTDDHFRRYALLRDAELRRLEFRSRMEPLPPGIDFNGGLFAGRDRSRDRDLAMRDHRSRDDRDQSRDRDRRRSDYDKDRSRGDWGHDRDRHSDRSRNRDRSPSHSGRGGSDADSRSSKYNDYDVEDERGNGSSSERYRRESDAHSEDKGADKWVCNLPSRTIILRNLPFEVDEKMIGAELVLLGLPVKDIRLIRRASGVSRGFAFVEFHNAADAQRWMEQCQGTFVILNQHASMDYSSTRDRGSRDNLRNDWVCSKCLSHNFKRRDFCFNCNIPRKESEKGKPSDGLDEIGTNPCNTLIFRGLDALTTEEALVTSISQTLVPMPLPPIKNIAIIRDDLGTSRGFGFVEFHSVSASTLVLDCLSRLIPPLEVDGKQLLMDYAKNTFNTTMAYIQQKAQAQQQLDYYAQYYGTAAPGIALSAEDIAENATNAAAAVAQAAIQQAQAVKNYQKQILNKDSSQVPRKTVTVNGVEYPVYPPPDTSSYQYEETSGYYYDPLTQLYYDANSQYYYNSSSGTYMYWDAEKSTYLPAPDNLEASKDDSQNKKESKEEVKEEKKEKEKGKTAKKIAKDMEKWAKSLNAQKEAQREVKKSVAQAGGAGVSKHESAAADAGFAILQKVKDDISLMPPPPKPESSAAPKIPLLVASYGSDSESGDEEDPPMPAIDESKLVDWTKLACLLCKRQFQSKDILSKHLQVSELHKQNLETLMKSKGISSAEKIEYRDRAKERRQKYGVPEPPEPQKKKDSDLESPAAEIYEEPTKFGIGGENIGSKLLQKMGWSEGQGLGKANQGRVDPIEAKRRNQTAGLGLKGANSVTTVGDDYRVALKKTLFARYNELD
ncbi:hypothetical protein BsWGS_11187 [Bradybaena similaris]